MLYRMVSEKEWREFKTHATEWDSVRYHLEVHLGLQGHHRWSKSFLRAMLFEDWLQHKQFVFDHSLKQGHNLNKNSKIILFRHPYPSILADTGPYVPVEILMSREFDKTNNEDEKIAAVMKDKLHFKLHPAEYRQTGLLVKPAVNYVCHGCQKTGAHFYEDCSEKNSNCTPASLPRPYGIPKSMLLQVHEYQPGVMRDEDGRLVVYKRPEKPQHTAVPVETKVVVQNKTRTRLRRTTFFSDSMCIRYL